MFVDIQYFQFLVWQSLHEFCRTFVIPSAVNLGFPSVLMKSTQIGIQQIIMNPQCCEKGQIVKKNCLQFFTFNSIKVLI